MNVTNNTNNLSVTAPLNLEQEPSTALAVLNVTSSTQRPETLATHAHTNAAVFDPTNWSSLAQNLAQGQPSTPIVPPQVTSAGRRQQASDTSTETGESQPIVRRRQRRTTSTTSTPKAENCKAGELIIKKDGNNYKCLKLSDAFPEKGVLMDSKGLLSQKTDSTATSTSASSASKGTTYPQIKDLFGNSTESKQIHAEVLQRMVMTTNSALKADEKWRWQLYLNNSAESTVDNEIFQLSNLTRLLELDNEEFPDNWIFFRGDCFDDTATTNCTESATNSTNSATNSTCLPNRSYRPHYFNQTGLPANRTCANGTENITFDDFKAVTTGNNKKSPGPSQVYSNYTAWLTGDAREMVTKVGDVMWPNLRDRPLLDVFMIGLASGMSLVSIILLIASCVRVGKRNALIDRLQNERDKEVRAIKNSKERAEREQETRDNQRREQEAHELGVLAAFNRYRFTDHRSYFSDNKLDLAALNTHHHQNLVQQADDAFARTQAQAQTETAASGTAEAPSETPNNEPKPWMQRYLLPDSAFVQGLDVPPPPYNVVDFLAEPTVGPVESNERLCLIEERRLLVLTQEKLKAVRNQRGMLEEKILAQEGYISPKERRSLRELQVVEGDLEQERRHIERSILELESQMVQRSYDRDASGLVLLDVHPETILSRAAVMPASSEAELELDRKLLAAQLQEEELPSYYEATQISLRPARNLLDMSASITALKAKEELEQKQRLRQRILMRAEAFDLQTELLLAGKLEAEVAPDPSDKKEDEIGEKGSGTEKKPSNAANKPDDIKSKTDDVAGAQGNAHSQAETSSASTQPSLVELSEKDRESIAQIRMRLQQLQATEESAAIDIPVEAEAQTQPLLAEQNERITAQSSPHGGARAKTTIFVSGGKTVSKNEKEQKKRKLEAQRLAYATAEETRKTAKDGVRQSLRGFVEGSVQTSTLQQISSGPLLQQSQNELEQLLATAFDTGQAPEAADFAERLVSQIEQTVTEPWQLRMEQVIDNVLTEVLPADSAEAREFLNNRGCVQNLNRRLATATAQVFQAQITPGITPATVQAMLDTISQSMLNSLTLGEAQALWQIQLEETKQRISAQSGEFVSIEYYEKMMSLQKAICAKMETHKALQLSSEEIKLEIEEAQLQNPTTQALAIEEHILAKNPSIIAARERRIALPSERITFYRPPPLEDKPKEHATQNTSQLERSLLEIRHCQLAAIANKTAAADEQLMNEEQQQIGVMVEDRINAEAARQRRLERERAIAFASKIPAQLRAQLNAPLSNKTKDKEDRATKLVQLNFDQPAQTSTVQSPESTPQPAKDPKE